MEIKSTLNKPYTEEQKIDFIVTNNHNLGYEIRETETELQAWGYTQDEITEQEKQRRNSEIDSKIKELSDMASVEMVKGNTVNVQTYKEVIKSLDQSKT